MPPASDADQTEPAANVGVSGVRKVWHQLRREGVTQGGQLRAAADELVDPIAAELLQHAGLAVPDHPPQHVREFSAPDSPPLQKGARVLLVDCRDRLFIAITATDEIEVVKQSRN